MSVLIAFLNARLDEDEAVALATAIPRAAGDGITDDTAAPQRTPNTDRLAWRVSSEVSEEGTPVHWVIANSADSAAAVALGLERGAGPDVARHIARHDPARTLRKVAAYRSILVRYETCYCYDRYGRLEEYEDFVLPALAREWSGHPDYRQEW